MRNGVGMRGIWVGLPRIRVEMREINMEMWEIEVGMREIDTAQKIKLSIKHFFSINEIKVCKIQFSFFAEIEKKKKKKKKTKQ